MEVGIIIVLIIIYTFLLYIAFVEDKHDTSTPERVYSNKMIKSTRDSALSGVLFGLTTSDPQNCIANGILWGCIGGIKTYITRHC